LGETEVQLNDEAQEFRWLSLGEAKRLPLNQPTRVLLDRIDSGACSELIA
jgi:hypothetical protein